jgi:enoyl-CoA hydratase
MGIVVTRDGAVALVEVDRQASLNALDIETVTELEARVRELAEDVSVRCLVLTGAGDRAFIGGADLAYMSQVSHEQALEFAAIGQEVGRLLETMPKPTIAAVNGYALGGGCEMALACDIRYASSNAKLGQPEVTFGLIPGWGGSQRLARTTTLGFAKELIFSGRHVGADEALRRGLVDAVADPVREHALARATVIARNSPSALGAAKELCNRALQGEHAANLAAECERIVEVLVSADAREGCTAFLEQREPAFARAGIRE